MRRALAALLILAAGAVLAQPFPARPVRVIVPFSPGGFNTVTLALPFIRDGRLAAMTSAEFARFVKSEIEDSARIAQAAGIRVQ